MLTAEYGGSGGKPIETGLVVEEPDIEIGAGVSSKGNDSTLLLSASLVRLYRSTLDFAVLSDLYLLLFVPNHLQSSSPFFASINPIVFPNLTNAFPSNLASYGHRQRRLRRPSIIARRGVQPEQHPDQQLSVPSTRSREQCAKQ